MSRVAVDTIMISLTEIIGGIPGNLSHYLKRDFELSEQEFKEKWHEAETFFEETCEGYHTEEEFWGHFCRLLKADISIGDLETAMRWSLDDTTPGIVTLLNDLKHRGIKLVLWSDFIKELAEYAMETHPFIEKTFGEHIHFSYDYGVQTLKRNPNMIEKILMEEQLEPAKTLLVYSKDADGNAAVRTMLEVAQFRGAEHLKDWLWQIYDIRL